MNHAENGTPRASEPVQPHDPWLGWLLSPPVLWLGTVLALVSVVDGIRNSILRSLDFQWSPARLLAQHIDPWATYLAGDPGHRILLNQVPNYLHELYVAMLPFGYLPLMPAKLIWAVINLALVLISCFCVARMYELEGRHAWLLAVLVLTSTPARVTIGNGQVTALILASLALWALALSSSARGLLLGAAWAKYSVPPVLAAFLLLRRRWRLLLYSLLPPALGFLFIYGWLRTPFWTLLLEPFRTSTNNVSPGLANIMAVSEIALRRPPFFHPMPDAFYLAPSAGWALYVPYLCGVLLALGVAAYFSAHGKDADGRILMACLTAASLLCFKHQIYDFLLLIFPLAVALKAGPGRARNWLLGLIAYFWYAERLLHIRRWEFWPAVVILSFGVLLALIAATWKLCDRVRWRVDWKL
ncbi:MAG TPA: glycosyltransferase 87 family protein [Acidobacteriaceae bacterium]|nr:glycosyltransferase 87 family protein [Acidobacteriaceae bacterium]